MKNDWRQKIDVEKIALEYYPVKIINGAGKTNGCDVDFNKEKREIFKAAYDLALFSRADKEFTIEDMCKSFDLGHFRGLMNGNSNELKKEENLFHHLIQSIRNKNK